MKVRINYFNDSKKEIKVKKGLTASDISILIFRKHNVQRGDFWEAFYQNEWIMGCEYELKRKK